jgi:hypothetical protein
VPELKFFPQSLSTTWTSGSGATFGTTAAYLELSGLILGGGDTGQRIGRDIFITDILIEGTVMGGQSNLATDDKYNVVRLALLEGTPTTLGTSIGSNFSNSYFMRPDGMVGLEKVLFDRTVELPSPGKDSTGYMPPIQRIKVRIPVNRALAYTSTSGLSSFRTFYMAAVSDSSAAPNPGFINGYLTINYYDV